MSADPHILFPDGSPARKAPMSDFASSDSSADRSLTWAAIKRSKDLNNNQRAVLRYLVNLWFYHRIKAGVIHPGVGMLGKRCRVSASTAQRCLRLFEAKGFIRSVRYQKGGTGCATQYTLDDEAIRTAYLPTAPKEAPGNLVEIFSNVTRSKPGQNPVNGISNPVKLTDCLKGPTVCLNPATSNVPSEEIPLSEMEQNVWNDEGNPYD